MSWEFGVLYLVVMNGDKGNYEINCEGFKVISSGGVISVEV